MRKLNFFVSMIFSLIIILLFTNSQPHISFAAPFQKGDIFASVGDGLVQHYNPSGELLEILDTGKGSDVYTTGCGFDSAGNLYVTTFNGGDVIVFSGPDDPHTNLGAFGSEYSGNPESIVFDAVGNVYIGSVEGDCDIRKFDPYGNLLVQYDVAIENRGSDWIDLSKDQRTMFYTSEGKRIMRYDLISNVQLPDFASLLAGYAAYALRILPDDSVIVADTEFILHLDSLGNEIQRYDAPGEDTWFALNIDPDGTSFWAGSVGTGKIYKFDIATGGDPLLTIDAGVEYPKLYGICVYGAQ